MIDNLDFYSVTSFSNSIDRLLRVWRSLSCTFCNSIPPTKHLQIREILCAFVVLCVLC